MSIASRTRLHTVTVLEPTYRTGNELGNNDSWAPADPPRVLTCTVVPGAPFRVQQMLLQQGVQKPYTLYFSSEPQNIDERRRLLWRETTLRIVGPPTDEHGLGRLWTLYCDAATDDNPGNTEMN